MCSEVELSDDEVQNKKSKTVKASSVQKDKIYQCDNCENSYSSVAGLRTPFTQLLQTRVCFTNAGINNNKI